MLFDVDDFIDMFIVDFNEATGFITTEEECSEVHDRASQFAASIATLSLNPCFFTASNSDEEMITLIAEINIVGEEDHHLNVFVRYADDCEVRGGEIPYLFVYEI